MPDEGRRIDSGARPPVALNATASAMERSQPKNHVARMEGLPVPSPAFAVRAARFEVTAMSINSGPGYSRNPGHKVEARPAGVRVRVTFNGEVIADTRDAIRMEEDSYPPVYYVPHHDVKMQHFNRTDHTTYCPFKGHASYYSLSAGGRIAENAVWSYEQPYDEVSVIRERLAFYPNKVDRIETLPV